MPLKFTPDVATRQKPVEARRRWLTWGNLVWLLIVVIIVLTILVMVWASRQPPIHTDPGPPLS